MPRYSLAPPNFTPPPPNTPIQNLPTAKSESPQKRKARGKKITDRKGYVDPLKDLRIESELRREIRENIAHQRMIGSYVGRRHAMHLPVRGQNTQSNAKTARKLNQLDRY
jgi:small subunit ribosomal protein S13